MKTCINHHKKKAFSICHSCGKDYCEQCLIEGKEYYYCNNPKCQKLLHKELSQDKLPTNVICPKCESELELSEDERIFGKVSCPECEEIIDFKANPPISPNTKSDFFAPEKKGIQKGVMGGITMMAIAAVWFIVGYEAGYIFYYPPILFLIGLYAFFNGISTGNISGGGKDLESNEYECAECHADVKEEDKICPKCGANLEE